MPVIHRRGWELPEHQATPEKLFLDRRRFLAAAGAAAGALSPALAFAQRVSDLPDPSASLYPVKQNPKFVLDRPVTAEAINITYNNYYEFGSAKSISRSRSDRRPICAWRPSSTPRSHPASAPPGIRGPMSRA